MSAKIFKKRKFSLLRIYVRHSPDYEQFKSMMDCVFVMHFPEHFDACLDYYDGNGEPLHGIVSRERLREMDIILAKKILGMIVFVNTTDPEKWYDSN